jgi:hypothetical protein
LRRVPLSARKAPVRKRCVLAPLLVLLLTWPVAFSLPARADDRDREVDAVLSAAESLFVAMKERDDRRTWELLTTKSRDAIARGVVQALSASGETAPSVEAVRRDFAGGGPIARTYWDGFLTRFDPRMALDESRWEIGSIKRNDAEILITYKDAENPVRLRMVREERAWRIGLIETFW